MVQVPHSSHSQDLLDERCCQLLMLGYNYTWKGSRGEGWRSYLPWNGVVNIVHVFMSEDQLRISYLILNKQYLTPFFPQVSQLVHWTWPHNYYKYLAPITIPYNALPGLCHQVPRLRSLQLQLPCLHNSCDASYAPLRCLTWKIDFRKNHRDKVYTGYACGPYLSLLCFRACSLRCPGVLKAFLQKLQMYGRSPVCTRMWVVRLPFSVKVLLQPS